MVATALGNLRDVTLRALDILGSADVVAAEDTRVSAVLLRRYGINHVDLLDLGVEAGVVEKSGAWFSFEEERIGQGRENARRFLRENPDARERLAEKVYAAKGTKRAVPARPPEPAAEAE